MSRHTLVIKGDIVHVLDALAKNGVTASAFSKHPRYREVCVYTEEVERAPVVDWFNKCLDLKPPFPDGTLMWYGPISQREP